MKKRKSVKMLNVCNECGKLQPKNQEKSNENFDVYDCNVKCDCGGDFVTEWVEE